MKPLLGIKAMMLGVFCAPFLVICIYFLIRPQPLEIPPELTHLDSGTQLYEAGLLDLAIAEYDLATEIYPDNLVAYQNGAMLTLPKETWAAPWWTTTRPLTLGLCWLAGLGHKIQLICCGASRRPTWGRP